MSESTRPPPTRQPTGSLNIVETDAERLDRYRKEQKADQATLVDLDDRVRVLEELVGRLPSALPGDKGTGLAQHIVDLGAKLDALAKAIDADREARAKEAEERSKELAALAKRREPFERWIWIVVGVVTSTVVGGGLLALGAWFARHWN